MFLIFQLLEYHPRSIFLKEAESCVEKHLDSDKEIRIPPDEAFGKVSYDELKKK
jgi:FKBP-type peptidyl-prolyl cis-trans isomerase 2